MAIALGVWASYFYGSRSNVNQTIASASNSSTSSVLASCSCIRQVSKLLVWGVSRGSH